jgi:pimeloyl-ACP methyl ester carboxylesterase
VSTVPSTRAIPLAFALALAAGAAACARTDAPPTTPPPPAAPLAQAADQYLTVSGMRLRYRETGSGEPVVLLHGFASDIDSWSGLGDSIATGYRVIALDQRGHGRSGKPAGEGGYGRELGADVLRLLDHLGLQRAHLVGHSMGAVVASYAAVRHPQRFATASLLAPPFYPDSAAAASVLSPVADDLERGDGLRGFLRRFAPELPDSVAETYNAEMMKAGDRDMMIGVMRSFGGFTVGQAGAATASVPALVAVGGRDVLATNARALAGWWPHARLLEIAEADHVNILWHPETLTAIRAQLAVRGTDPGER